MSEDGEGRGGEGRDEARKRKEHKVSHMTHDSTVSPVALQFRPMARNGGKSRGSDQLNG